MIQKQTKLKMGTDENNMRYYIDTTTRNLSFLQTQQDLKKLGIENNAFFLRIYNRDLVGVDPYDPALSQNMIAAIIMECLINPYYFLRELARVPDQGGSVGVGGGSPYILHRGNLAATFCLLHCIDNYLLLPRQCFKTHSMLAIIDWVYLFGTTNSQFNFLCMSQPSADANLDKLKAQKALLPEWIQQKYNFVDVNGEIKIDKGICNVRKLSNPITKNWIETKPSARTEASADLIGRGNTAPIQWSDETEFTPFMGTIIMASGPAYVRAAENANRNHAIHCRMFTTTPGNIDSEPVESTNPTRENAALFTEKFYDWDNEKISEYMSRNSKNGICYIEFTYRQIGMNEDYFRQMVNVLEGNKIKIKREVLLQRVRGANDSPFDEEDLDAINDNRKEPIREIVIQDYYILYVYEEIEKTTPYIVAVDPSTGLGINSDNTAINIIDPYTLRSIAVLKTPYADPVESTQIIVELITKYVPRALLVIERNNLGVGIIAILVRSPISANLYYDSSKVLGETGEDKLNRRGYLDSSPESRRYWGVTTVEKNRHIMTKELLTYMVKNCKDRFIARELIDDLNNLYMKASGRIEARPRCHDDVIMSFLIGIYVYEYGKNLDRWGIVKGMMPSKVNAEKKPVTYEEAFELLPDNLREFFPNPNEKQRINLLYTQDDSNVVDDEIYHQIQNIQNHRNRTVVQSDGTNIAIRSNTSTSQIMEDVLSGSTSQINEDTFDIVDIINNF